MSWESGGIPDAAGMRSIAPGVVGVEGCVGAVRGGSVDESAVSGVRMLMGKPGMGAGSEIGEGVGAIEFSGNSSAREVSGVGDGVGAREVSGVGDGAVDTRRGSWGEGVVEPDGL